MKINSILLCALLIALSTVVAAEESQSTGPREFTFRVLGLFSPDRMDDLRALASSLPQGKVRVVSVDYERATAIFEFDPDEVCGKIDPTKIVERFDQIVGRASRRTFSILPVSEVPIERLVKVEIPIVGLDCKGCSLAAYECVSKLEGVERATASFKVGLLVAWIEPEKTNRATLEESLVKRKVALKKPAPAAEK
jgi:hypothetical protein